MSMCALTASHITFSTASSFSSSGFCGFEVFPLRHFNISNVQFFIFSLFLLQFIHVLLFLFRMVAVIYAAWGEQDVVNAYSKTRH